MVLVWFLVGGFLRRWYGGLFPDDKHKVLGNRALQTIVMLGAMLGIFVDDWQSWRDWLVSGTVALWLQFQFWSRGHGEIADCGRKENLNEDDIKRYNKYWYHYICDFILKNHKYGFLYDFLYMLLRYTCPLFPLAIINWKYLIVGLFIPLIYAFSMTLEEREKWLFCKPWLSRGWALAEIISGGIFFSTCYLLQL